MKDALPFSALLASPSLNTVLGGHLLADFGPIASSVLLDQSYDGFVFLNGKNNTNSDQFRLF